MAAERLVVPYRQAVEEVLQLLTGQWVPAVLTALALGPLKFSDICSEVNSVEEKHGQHIHQRPLSDRMLARTLDRMEENRLILRHQDGAPGYRTVNYELTRRGQALLAVLRPLAEWIESNDLRPTI